MTLRYNNLREQFNPKLNLKTLPIELVVELNHIAHIDSKIITIFKQGGGTLNISEVLVGFYQLYGEVKKRTYMMPTLYRMSKKGLLKPTDKKGEYILATTSNNERII